MEINAIGILGADSAGAALAELFVKNGFQVRVYDHFKDSIAVALAKINWSLKRAGEADLAGNVEGVQDFAKFRGADIIIEASCRELDQRKLYFSKLKEHLEPGCIVAPCCAVETLATALEHTELPFERTVGLNFARPVRSNGLVEVVRSEKTGEAQAEACMALMRRLGKTPVLVRDNPGQIAERLLRPLTLAAFRLLEAGKGFPGEIDEAFRAMSGAPAGPFEMADAAGLDADAAVAQRVYEGLGRPERLAPSPTELRLVQYGQLGRKSTIGFYIYEDGLIAGENPILANIVKYLGLRKCSREEIFADILRPVLEEAKLLAGEVMASEYDIETAARLAFGWPKGPFAFGRELGAGLEKKKVSEFDRLDSL